MKDSSEFPPLGEAPLPEGFPYLDVLQKGRPVQQKTDPFRIRHPSMEVSRRAKIFAPFDALRGFDTDDLASKAAEAAAEAAAANEPPYSDL